MTIDLAISADSLFDGELTCNQHVQGYRFSIDPVILAHFTPLKKGTAVMDLGAGCGIISLILQYRYQGVITKITAVEIQEALFKLVQQNVTINGYGDIITPILGDLKRILDFCRPETYDYLFCNPPFFKAESGRKNTNTEALHARHQILSTLEDVINASKKILKNRGSLNLIYPAKAITELITVLSQNNFEVKRLQFIYGYPESPVSSLVVLEAIKNGGAECKVLPPMYVYEEKNGEYSTTMKRFYAINSQKT